ncbi:MAG: hypothetical protein H6Q26_371 [Bacteroidetes bacterium]|nr:hypothetical protein [Bacteroidota bacterium]
MKLKKGRLNTSGRPFFLKMGFHSPLVNSLFHECLFGYLFVHAILMAFLLLTIQPLIFFTFMNICLYLPTYFLSII